MILQNKLLPQILRDAAAAVPEKTALCFRDCELTYRSFDARADQFAAALIQMGLKPGDHAALWGYTALNWLPAFFGILRAGGVAVLINYGLSGAELEQQLRFADVGYLLYGESHWRKQIPGAVEEVCRVAGLAEEKTFDFNTGALPEVTAKHRKIISDIETTADPKALSVIIYTTGTTSTPKAVTLMQFALVNNVINQLEIDEMDGTGSICLALPLFHSFGLAMALLHILNHTPIYFPQKISPDEIMPLIERYQITDVASVFSVYKALRAHPDFDRVFSRYVYHCAIGGASADPNALADFEHACAHAFLKNGYGMTECAPYITLIRNGDSLEKRAHSVGRPIPHVTVKIKSPEGEELPAGACGEITVAGYNVTPGYYKLPKEDQPFDGEGMLHTGDLGRFDDEGYLHILGRIKDIIIRCGETISPMEVEEAIYRAAQISEVKVLGVHDEIYGERIEACVIPAPGAVFREDAVREALKKYLAVFKIPAHFLVFERFPVNENQKLDIKALRAAVQERLAAEN